MASDNKLKARVSSILFMIGIVVALFFIEFTFAENPPTVEVSDPFPEEMEIKDVVAETNKPSNSSSARNPDPKPKPPAPVNNNNSSEQLTDNTPDNSVSNPFGGQNGGGNNTNGFGQGNEGNGQTGNSGSGNNGKGYGDPKRENNPKPPDYDTDFSGNVCVELLINAQGKAISAKSCNSTSHPDQNVIKSVVEFVKKNVKYKAEQKAPNRTAYYTVYIKAG
jgi:hypothetical protein